MIWYQLNKNLLRKYYNRRCAIEEKTFYKDTGNYVYFTRLRLDNDTKYALKRYLKTLF